LILKKWRDVEEKEENKDSWTTLSSLTKTSFKCGNKELRNRNRILLQTKVRIRRARRQIGSMAVLSRLS
jgi:hypothetical protein